uniref:dihydrofolate reductase n=1 Tax=viral metagenome TaxID=1070528 RepID=A0A6C0L0Z6_9ZZZZ|tara:strand:- start:22487 stop:23023 length:537 start_codon:yes stop_codon:yes gene_type:complete
MEKTLNIIACCDNKMGIGIDNKLPWSISSEMKIFKEKTIGNGNNCVIMGKNTYLSVPEKYRPLSERYNCIVSSNYELSENKTDCRLLRNLNADLISLLNCTNYKTYWIIGGSSVYHEIMAYYPHLVNEIHISILQDDYKCNKFFPIIDKSKFVLKDKSQNEKDKYTHFVYKNNCANCK